MVFHGVFYLSAQLGNGLHFGLRSSLIRSGILRRLRYKVSIRRFIPLTSYSYHSSGTRAAYRQSSSRSICSARVSAGSNDSHAVTFSYTRCRAYLFQSEYIFDLERSVIVETPQLGHATYLFSKPVNMTEFLALYGKVTKDDIRRNRGSLAERLGFWGRLIHGHDPRTWLKELKTRFGETVDYALCEN